MSWLLRRKCLANDPSGSLEAFEALGTSLLALPPLFRLVTSVAIDDSIATKAHCECERTLVRHAFVALGGEIIRVLSEGLPFRGRTICGLACHAPRVYRFRGNVLRDVLIGDRPINNRRSTAIGSRTRPMNRRFESVEMTKRFQRERFDRSRSREADYTHDAYPACVLGHSREPPDSAIALRRR